MQAGKRNRSTGATAMNLTSSRSHSIFTIVVECGESDARGDHIKVGKLNLVDLAGSERQSKVSSIRGIGFIFDISILSGCLVFIFCFVCMLVVVSVGYAPVRFQQQLRVFLLKLGTSIYRYLSQVFRSVQTHIQLLFYCIFVHAFIIFHKHGK